MTTCARCGQPVYPGASTCPSCGAAMGSQNFGPANSPSAFGPGQQPPASAFPGAPRNGNANGSFSAGSLLSSDALPDWLLQAGAGAPAGQPASGFGRGPFPGQGYGYGAPPQQMYGQPYGQPPVSDGLGQQPVSGGLGQPRPMAPNPYPGQPGATSAQALFDESALPDWLRQAATGYDASQQPTAYHPAAPNPAYGGGPARYGAPPATPMSPGYPPNGYNGYNGYPPAAPQRSGPSTALGQSPYPSTQASAFPSLDMAGANGVGNPGGMSARGLIDSGALPGWLGGQASRQQTAGGPSLPGSGGLSARSLIDDTALPQWLRAQPAPAQPAAPPRMSPPAPVSAWGAPATADEPLPSWLNQAYMDANVRPIEPVRAPSDWLSPGQGSAPLGGSSAQTEGRLSASAFVDETALPEWLKSQGGVPAVSTVMPAAATYAAPTATQEPRAFAAYAPGGPSTGQTDARSEGKFSVSDLIDPEALPSWVGGQVPSSETSWTSKQSSALAATASSTSLRASSTIEASRASGEATGGWDEPNLPGWMRGLGPDEGNQPSRAYPSAPSSRTHSDELIRDEPVMGLGASSLRRRGHPIPSEDLPPWLRSSRAGGDAQQAGGYVYQRTGQRPAAPQQEWWPEEQDAQQRWTDWDEDSFGAEYDGGMDFPDERERRPLQEKQRGGWRRLFGRR